MKRALLSLNLLCVLAAAAVAAPVLPPDKLLPSDTWVVLTMPDAAKARARYGQWPGAQLWKDAAAKPFRDKLTAKFKAEIVDPLEKELGIKFADYADLAQGQVTLALGPVEGGGVTDYLLLLDARDKSDALKAKLTDLKKKWVDGGRQIKTDKVRDVEFTTLIFSTEDLTKSLDKAFTGPDAGNPPDAAAKPARGGRPLQLMLGQSDSLFLLGGSPKIIEKVLSRQAGGGVPSLSEQPAFAANYNALFRDSLTYGWVNAKAILDMVMKRMPANDEEPPPPGQFMPRPDRILSALGLTGLQSLAFNIRELPEGSVVQFQINVPESVRKGLFKLIAFDAKDSSPPPFVPADAVKFSRFRLDLPKAWATLEQSLVEAVPQAAGVIKLLVDNAGKDKDPDFDLRKSFIANLGDDVIMYEKAPRQQTFQDLQSPPALVLISSPKAEQLAAAVKALGSVVPQRGGKFKEREFLGRTVYSMNFALPGMPGQRAERPLNYAASGSYVGFSYDMGLLEEYLRNSGTAPKPLRELPGLADAAQKVGGMNNGLFSYENQVETMRATLQILKKESGGLSRLFGASPVASRLGLTDQDLQEWVDLSLLPPFEQIAKYFSFTVSGATVTPDGIGFRVFSPNPPPLRK